MLIPLWAFAGNPLAKLREGRREERWREDTSDTRDQGEKQTRNSRRNNKVENRNCNLENNRTAGSREPGNQEVEHRKAENRELGNQEVEIIINFKNLKKI